MPALIFLGCVLAFLGICWVASNDPGLAGVAAHMFLKLVWFAAMVGAILVITGLIMIGAGRI